MLRRLRPLPLLLAATWAASCASSADRSGVAARVADGDFQGAVALAERHAEASPDDPEAQRVLREARLAWLLDRGRAALFRDENEDALDLFNSAFALDPGNPVTAAWLAKTRDKLAGIWLEAARSLSRTDLGAALEAYEIALHYVPDDPDTLEGAARAVFLMNHRQGLGEHYYNQGVDALHGYRLVLADYEFDKTLKYLPGDERAVERDRQATLALAEGRLAVARALEDEGLWSAAMNEYRLALLLDPHSEAAVAGRDRMGPEVQASALLSEADMLIRQNRLEEALVKLDEGRALTAFQDDEFDRLVNEIEIVHWEALYQKALMLELDYQYEEAVEAYERLLAEAEFYGDAGDRLTTLREFIERAGALYARVLDTRDPDEERALLRQISTFWPEYRDVKARLRALEG